MRDAVFDVLRASHDESETFVETTEVGLGLQRPRSNSGVEHLGDKRCGKAMGSHEHQNPSDVGTVVRSVCQIWLGRRAWMPAADFANARLSFRRGGGMCSIRATVVVPR